MLTLLLAASFLLPLPALAREGAKTVRVGWFDSPFNRMDRFGRRSGYSYEYQRKLVAYTGWRYEYVEGSWPELLEMLKEGEIDLLSDVSYTEERTESILYSSLPMGTETYYIFVAPDNGEISSNDYFTLNGKRIGVNKGSIQKDFFLEWASARGIEAELTELTTSVEEAITLLHSGKLDAYITLDATIQPGQAIPICKIGASDFYFAVSKDRPDLLMELDAALNRIQDENREYNRQLSEKYLHNAGTSRYLNTDEKEWVLKHRTIRVGYQDNYLAFCAADPETGELTGALKDYLDYAASAFENARLSFEAIVYPTAAAAMEALARGEVDCMFPANLTDSDGESLGVVMSPPLMRSEMDAVVRASDQKEFIRREKVMVAVNEGNTNYDMFLMDNFPSWDRAYFTDTPAGLDAVAAGEADCVIISNYRFSNISRQCEKLHLTTVYTGVDMDYCFAVREGDTALYSLLARITGIVPDAIVHAALTYHSTEDVKTTFTDLIKDNLLPVMSGIFLVLLVILVLLLRSIRAEKKAREEEYLVKDLNRQVFVDALTSVRNKGGFDNYIRELQDKLDGGEELSFAIAVCDCDNLKTVNDANGHDKGDLYLKTASRLICSIFQHSPVFRIGGDEFAVVLQNEDFQNREELVRRFREEQGEINASAENEWEEAHISLGVAVYDPQVDSSVSDAVRRADKIMYDFKRREKIGRR